MNLKSFRRIVFTVVIGLTAGSAQAAPSETKATRDFLVEMERMNPRVSQLKASIAQGADVNASPSEAVFKGFPALHIAVWKSHRVVQLLVDKGAAMDAQDRNGDTAMAIAAECAMVETVVFLLDKGADPNIRNVNGRSVLGKAKYTLTRSALSASHKRQVQIIVDILESKGAKA